MASSLKISFISSIFLITLWLFEASKVSRLVNAIKYSLYGGISHHFYH